MKVTSYNITVNNAYIDCDDVPTSTCCEIPCSECPFFDEDVTLEELITKYIEMYRERR